MNEMFSVLERKDLELQLVEPRSPVEAVGQSGAPAPHPMLARLLFHGPGWS